MLDELLSAEARDSFTRAQPMDDSFHWQLEHCHDVISETALRRNEPCCTVEPDLSGTQLTTVVGAVIYSL